MKLFRYTALDRSGGKLAGEMEGDSRDSVLAHLQTLGHFPVEVSETRKPAPAPGMTGFSGRPSSSQLTLLTHELAMLLKAGLPLDRSLQLLATDAGSKSLSQLVMRLHAEISGGKSLYEAMAAQGGVFPPVYTNMVRIAEASGTLDAVLERIAQSRQRAEKLRGKVLSASLYPALLVTVAVAAVVLMLVFVVPRFKEMVMQAGSEAPAAAAAVFAMSDWLIANGVMLLLALCAGAAGLTLLMRQPSSREATETALLRLPLIGHIVRLSLTVAFCRTLGVLLENGVELPVAMRLVRDVSGNRSAAAALERAYDNLRKGRSFIDPLAHSGLFPPVVINMLRVGEETGGLTRSLLHMADLFEDKLDTSVQRTLTLLEPVIILLVSGFIATVIISILSAVISINDLAL
ncbi:type II secretion system F family protein [Rhodomicrobium vannielii]|uniref:type II secretion system F family protein n=1 Tax=Rhodomicrobium vannielii TaxID=1069 RepID=UPI001FDA6589|nr:type II secretion system F family protein [Rhodomicrobium vannielii]